MQIKFFLCGSPVHKDGWIDGGGYFFLANSELYFPQRYGKKQGGLLKIKLTLNTVEN